MKLTFHCIEEHGGGAWKRFDFRVVGSGQDCPGGTLTVHTTEKADFSAFVPGKSYGAMFGEVKEEAPPTPSLPEPDLEPTEPAVRPGLSRSKHK